MNDLISIIQSRRTIHEYTSEPVPEELLLAALQCAIRAPNHKLTNPWRFVRVASDLREKIADLAVEVKSEKRPVSDAQEKMIRRKVSSSPELVVVTQTIDSDTFRRREDYAACACAIQNLCLALWSEGVGSKWSSGGLTFSEKTYEMLNVDPDKEEIIAFVWIGYPKVTPDPPRRDLEDVLRVAE